MEDEHTKIFTELEGMLETEIKDTKHLPTLASVDVRLNSSNSVPSNSTSSSIGLNLIHSRLPKLAINIQAPSTSVLTPTPVPKNSSRSQQLQNIFKPLNFSLLEKNKAVKMYPIEGTIQTLDPNAIQSRILQALTDQRPDILPLPNLHIEINKLQGDTKIILQSSIQVLNKSREKFLKAQSTNQESRNRVLHQSRQAQLQNIFTSVKALDTSIPLKRPAWIIKPRKGTTKDYFKRQAILRQGRREQSANTETGFISKTIEGKVAPVKDCLEGMAQPSTAADSNLTTPKESNGLNGIEYLPKTAIIGDSQQFETQQLCQTIKQSVEIKIDTDGDSEKKPVLTKGQLKEVRNTRKKTKPRQRVLVLQRKSKICPGNLFKCRRTREKFTFTTVHRTITESGLALLTAAYALKCGAVANEFKVTRPIGKETMVSIPNSVPLTSSLRQISSNRSEHGKFSPDESSKCHCENLLDKKPNHKLLAKSPVRTRKSISEHPTMILVNRYTQTLDNSQHIQTVPRDGVFQHTIELFAYARRLIRKIELLKTKNVLLDIGTRPELKTLRKPPYSVDPLPQCTVALEKTTLKDVLSLAICDFLAHSGFIQASLPVIEVLSEVLESQYEKLTMKLKAAAEKEVSGISHGFLDPIDRVTTVLGIGGVNGLRDYYQRDVIAYHASMEQSVEKLENKLETLVAYKVRDNLDVSTSSRLNSCSATEAPTNRASRTPTTEPHALPLLLCDSISSETKPSSVISDLQFNFQIDSVPSLGSV